MPKSKTYRVVGAQPVLDHEPGQTFEASLDQSHEDFLVGVGALKVTQAKDEKSDKKD